MVLDAVIVVVISRAEATEPNDTTHFMDYNTQLMKTPCGVIHLKINNCRVKGGNYKVAVLLWSGDLYFQGKSLTHFFAGDSPQWRATRGPERKARMAPWSCMGWWLCSPSLTCLTYFPLAGLSSVHRGNYRRIKIAYVSTQHPPKLSIQQHK